MNNLEKIIFTLALLFLQSYGLTLCWNFCLMPIINGLNYASIWHSLGILILGRMLKDNTTETKC